VAWSLPSSAMAATAGARSRDEQSKAKVEASSGTREETQTSTLEGAEARGTRRGDGALLSCMVATRSRTWHFVEQVASNGAAGVGRVFGSLPG
jgi:hypothetical protein